MGSFTKFAVLDGSNAGRWLNVSGPDGKPTEDRLLVVGQDSERYRTAERLMRRAIIGYLEEHGKDSGKTPEFIAFSENETRRLQACLVKEWSFDEECTEANIMELFRVAPYVATEVDIFAGKRDRFAENWPKPCEPSQKGNSASPSPSPSSQTRTGDSPESQNGKPLSKSPEQPEGDTQS